MLQRIYGTVWNTKDELDLYLWRLEEARKRDHRRLGVALDLVTGLAVADPTGGGHGGGWHHLRRIREKTEATLLARNPHELGRCLEVLNLLDLAEMTFVMALDRKETRGLHVRPDYPFTNPLLSQAHIVSRQNGKPHLQWRSY